MCVSKLKLNHRLSLNLMSLNRDCTVRFWFDLFLEARAEILTKISLVFWSISRHQKDIAKLTDLKFIVSELWIPFKSNQFRDHLLYLLGTFAICTFSNQSFFFKSRFLKKEKSHCRELWVWWNIVQRPAKKRLRLQFRHLVQSPKAISHAFRVQYVIDQQPLISNTFVF